MHRSSRLELTFELHDLSLAAPAAMKRPQENDDAVNRQGERRGTPVQKSEWKQCQRCKSWYNSIACPRCMNSAPENCK